MVSVLNLAFRRAGERARRRRDYRYLLHQSDSMLRDIGLDRDRICRAVVLGKLD